jgi:hypothetical protein
MFVTGAAAAAARFRTSVGARIITAFVLAFPTGDVLVWKSVLSPLRSFPGIGGLILLASLGTVWGIERLWKKEKTLTILASCILAGGCIVSSVLYFQSFFRHFRSDIEAYEKFQTELVESCQWLKPQFDDFDVIIFDAFSMTYIETLVTLGYDPNRMNLRRQGNGTTIPAAGRCFI